MDEDDAAQRSRTDPEADRGGDSACWLRRVCPECGAMVEEPLPATCWHCGARVDPS